MPDIASVTSAAGPHSPRPANQALNQLGELTCNSVMPYSIIGLAEALPPWQGVDPRLAPRRCLGAEIGVLVIISIF